MDVKKRLRLPTVSGRSLAALAAAVVIGGGIGWVAHTPDEPAGPPKRYAGALPSVPPPPRREAPVQPSPPVSLPAQPSAPVVPAPSVTELPPWRRYAVAPPPLQGRIPIALVIDDVGIDVARSRRAIDLPSAVTMSLLPYGASIDRQAELARAKGHEIIVHVSMEADTRTVDPGPNALFTNLEPEEIARRLDWALTRFPGYVGFNNHMGSRFTANEAGMRVVLAEARKRGLLFLDSKTAPETIGAKLSTELGVPFAARQVFLDNDASAAAVTKQLAALESVARRDRGAIAIGHPHDGTLAALDAWIPTLAERGFVLVPLTALVKAPAPQAPVADTAKTQPAAAVPR
jgi:polysaccharide deacetylase 2 family uncharacterized protein YibQ